MKSDQLSSGRLFRATLPLVLGLFVILLVLLGINQPVAAVRSFQLDEGVNGERAVENTSQFELFGAFGATEDTLDVIVGDFDADGILDYFAANIADDSRLYFGDGSGGFSREVVYPWRGRAASGDFNGDGTLDLVINDMILLNDGSGELTSSFSIFDGSYGNLVVGDIDSDGTMDLLANRGFTETLVYRNLNGTGQMFLELVMPFAGEMAMADFSGNGLLDLVIADGENFNLIIPNQDFVGLNFSEVQFFATLEAATSVLAADFDNDGALDIIFANEEGVNEVFFNLGGGEFNIFPDASFGDDKGSTHDMATADFNGDGFFDIIAVTIADDDSNGESTAGQNKLYLNNGFGEFGDVDQYFGGENKSRSVAIADLNSDGALDVVVGNLERPNFIYLNSLGGGYGSGVAIDADDEDQNSYDAGVGDFDGDGYLDLAIANSGGDYEQVFYNDGTGNLTDSGMLLGFGAETTGMATADLNGDGALEIIAANNGVNSIFDLANNITSTFGIGLWSQAVETADLNGDHALDIIVGESGQNTIYYNDGNGNFTLGNSLTLSLSHNAGTYGLAIGDVNGDNRPDIAFGNYSRPDQLFIQDSNGGWRDPIDLAVSQRTVDVAFGDLDGDSDLDIVSATDDQQQFVYLNDGLGNFTDGKPFGDADLTSKVALDDLDGDGDLDAVVVNLGRSNFVHLNDGNANFGAGIPFGESNQSWGLALGDFDNDGSTDIVSTNFESENFIYFNNFRRFTGQVANSPIVQVRRPVTTQNGPAFSSPELVASRYVTVPYVLKDVDGDAVGQIVGEFSLDGGDNWQPAVPKEGASNQAVGTGFSEEFFPEATISGLNFDTFDMSFNRDDEIVDLEVSLALSYTSGSALSAYLFSDWPAGTGTLVTLFEYLNATSEDFSNLILRDSAEVRVDVAELPVVVQGYAATDTPVAIDSGAPNTIFSDITVAGGPIEIFDIDVVNLNGTHTYMGDLTFKLTSPSGTEIVLMDGECGSADDFSLNFADDAFFDEIVCPPTDGFTFEPLEPLEFFEGEDSNGTWRLTVEDGASGDGGSLDNWGLRIVGPIDVATKFMPGSGVYQPQQSLAAFTNMPADANITLWVFNDGVVPTEIGVSEWFMHSLGQNHEYVWDTFASGVFGESDNVVFRIEAYPQSTGVAEGTMSYEGVAAQNTQWPFISSQTYPFSLRGTQIQVLDENGPVANARVYRLPAGQEKGAGLLGNGADRPFLTNDDGFLQGRGELNIGDQLMALLPIDITDQVTFTERISLYHTSAPISGAENGPQTFPVADAGVQQLTVSENNPLTLFQVDVTLEWDARQDQTYLNQLQRDLDRASEVLYDITNGQAALGEINVYQGKENWTTSEVVVFAANDVRPSAAAGGIVVRPVDDQISATSVVTEAYLPGQIRMGPTWGRFGDPDANLGEDWARSFAHELSHFFFFLPDNYLGVENGTLIYTNCYGSFMTDVYNDEYSEFLTQAGWTGDCLKTVAETTTGRTDWETIRHFYPWFKDDPLLSGPTLLPLDVTNVVMHAPSQPDNTLAVPYFSLVDAASNPVAIRQGEGQGYLFRNADTADLTDDYVVALGTPLGNQMQARGARPGDRVCVHDFSQSDVRIGCTDVGTVEGTVQLFDAAGWNPQILVSAVNSATLNITVTQSTATPLRVQILPSVGLSQTFPIISAVADLQPVAGQPDVYAQSIEMPYPSAAGYVRVWADGAPQVLESMTQYMLSDGFDTNRSTFNTNRSTFNTNRSTFNTNRSTFNAPIASGDGQVKIYNVVDIFADTGTLSLQALVDNPNVPSWLSQVGRAYRFESSQYFERSIGFEYLQSAVPQGQTYEHTLEVYYSPDNGQTWQALETQLNTNRNLATAKMPQALSGDGIYMLAATLELPAMDAGWNLMSYPVPFTRSLPLAVDSLGSNYTTIYDNGPTASSPWLIFDRTVLADHPEYAPIVNTLQELTFGGVYWVCATDNVIPFVGLPASGRALADDGICNEGPAPTTFYGPIGEVDGVEPAVGADIVAYVNGNECGRGSVVSVAGGVGYVIQVAADDGENGCGFNGDSVTFEIAGTEMDVQPLWGNYRARYMPLGVEFDLYLPVLLGKSGGN